MVARTSSVRATGVGESQDYLREVEALYLSLRGKGLMISPADTAVVSAWEHDGIPLWLACRVVTRALRELAPRAGTPPLRYCDGAVREAYARRVGALAGASERAGPGVGASAGAVAAGDSSARTHADAGARERAGQADAGARGRLGAGLAPPLNAARASGTVAAQRVLQALVGARQRARHATERAAYAAAERALRDGASGSEPRAFLAAVTRADRALCAAFLRTLPADTRAGITAAARAADRRAGARASERARRALRHEVVGAALERHGLVRPLTVLADDGGGAAPDNAPGAGRNGR
ncbi:MAG TPA: hypothetical protein VG389_23635 [Myxococcota bacterium]|jgi:hypothetical protein|nr:hypothetical protein [Myxococcota bacterium]